MVAVFLDMVQVHPEYGISLVFDRGRISLRGEGADTEADGVSRSQSV
jgi:hypothetical protein